MTNLLQDKASRLRVSVIAEPSAETQDLVRHLQRARITPKHVWPHPETIYDGSDLIFCEFQRGLAKRIGWMPGEARAALILLLPQGGQFDLKEVADALPDAVLSRPYLPHMIDATTLVALDHFGFAKRQRQRIQRLDENIKALRDIEKAKYAIMERRNVSENDAYRILRDLAMERRTTIASVAEKMIDTFELGS